MAAIKKSELRLLVVFGILIFGAVTFFALDVVNGKKNDAIGLQRSYANKIREYNDLISQKEQWEVKREFVQRYQPVYRSEEQEAPALEAYFRSAAQGEGVEIKTLRPMPPEPLGKSMMAISLEAKVTGAGPDIMRFLIQLQAENRFYAIPSISIAADRKDPSVVTADMIFSRWFSLDGEMPPLDEMDPVRPVATGSQPAAEGEGASGDPAATEPPTAEEQPEPADEDGEAIADAAPSDGSQDDEPEPEPELEPELEAGGELEGDAVGDAEMVAEPEVEGEGENESETETESVSETDAQAEGAEP